MKTAAIIFILSLCSFGISIAQSFSVEYFKKLADYSQVEFAEGQESAVIMTLDSLAVLTSGKTYLELLASSAPASVANSTERKRSICRLAGIDIDLVDRIILVEEMLTTPINPDDFRRNGIVFVNDSSFGYTHDLITDETVLSKSFRDEASRFFSYRSSIITIIEASKTDLRNRLIERTQRENNPDYNVPVVQYEIVLFDQQSQDPIEVIWLNDFSFE